MSYGRMPLGKTAFALLAMYLLFLATESGAMARPSKKKARAHLALVTGDQSGIKAYHLAGHLIVWALTRPNDAPLIANLDDPVWDMRHDPMSDETLSQLTPHEALDRIVLYLAGEAAEEIFNQRLLTTLCTDGMNADRLAQRAVQLLDLTPLELKGTNGPARYKELRVRAKKLARSTLLSHQRQVQIIAEMLLTELTVASTEVLKLIDGNRRCKI